MRRSSFRVSSASAASCDALQSRWRGEVARERSNRTSDRGVLHGVRIPGEVEEYVDRICSAEQADFLVLLRQCRARRSRPVSDLCLSRIPLVRWPPVLCHETSVADIGTYMSSRLASGGVAALLVIDASIDNV